MTGGPADGRPGTERSRPCLVVATSGRLLVEALAGAGQAVDVLDSFGDLDCRALARHAVVLPWTAADDPSPASVPLLTAVDRWAAAHPQGVLVTGTGFEHRPALLEHLAARLPLAGSPAAACARCKDPWQLAEACADFGLDTPALARPASHQPAGWLARRVGGCGGSHLRPATGSDRDLEGLVWQRHTPGSPVSLLFHVTADQFCALSWQQQYCAPVPHQPWRFGGLSAVHPDGTAWAGPLARAAQVLSAHFGLRGLNGIDALWDGARLWILEINPRPPASLSLLPPELRARWMLAHLRTATVAPAQAHVAVHSRGLPWAAPEGLPEAADRHALNAGMAVVYASGLLSIPADFRFPPGCHDLPALPHTFGSGDPVCSVQVSAGGIEKLRTLIGILRERLLPLAGADILSSL